VLFFPQMRPEKIRKVVSSEIFTDAGIPEIWAQQLLQAGYQSLESLKNEKAQAIQQKLNGLRKKNKLDIPAVQLEEIMNWIGSQE
jgi:lysyl-tRNA synthetase, class II